MSLDFSTLADELADMPGGGPTLAEAAQTAQQNALLLRALDKLSSLTSAVTHVHVPEAQPPSIVLPEHPKATAWTFTFERNPDGTIASITATPKE